MPSFPPASGDLPLRLALALALTSSLDLDEVLGAVSDELLEGLGCDSVTLFAVPSLPSPAAPQLRSRRVRWAGATEDAARTRDFDDAVEQLALGVHGEATTLREATIWMDGERARRVVTVPDFGLVELRWEALSKPPDALLAQLAPGLSRLGNAARACSAHAILGDLTERHASAAEQASGLERERRMASRTVARSSAQSGCPAWWSRVPEPLGTSSPFGAERFRGGFSVVGDDWPAHSARGAPASIGLSRGAATRVVAPIDGKSSDGGLPQRLVFIARDRALG